MRLTGNIPNDTIMAIGEYFNGYTRVSELRSRVNNNFVKIEIGEKVLQYKMQERIVSDKANSQKSISKMFGVSEGVFDTSSMDKIGEEKVLQSKLFGQTQEEIDGKKIVKIWKETYKRDKEQNIRNKNVTKYSTENGKSSELEGGEDDSKGVCIGNDSNTPEGSTTNGTSDDRRKLYSGTQSSNVYEDRQTSQKRGNSTSHKRSKKRQQTREFDNNGEIATLKSTSEFGDGGGNSKTKEYEFEILACDIPDYWYDYFEYTGENLGCTPLGTRQVKGYTINRFTDGAKPFGGGAGHEYESENMADENGEETIDEWQCVEECAVRKLGEQSGESRTPDKLPQPQFGSPTGRIYGFQSGEGRNGKFTPAMGDSGTAAGGATAAAGQTTPQAPPRSRAADDRHQPRDLAAAGTRGLRRGRRLRTGLPDPGLHPART